MGAWASYQRQCCGKRPLYSPVQWLCYFLLFPVTNCRIATNIIIAIAEMPKQAI